jgi:hypothetical protein
VLDVAVIRIRAGGLQCVRTGIEQPPQIPTIGGMLFHGTFVPIVNGAAHLRRAESATAVYTHQYFVARVAGYLLGVERVKINRQFATGTGQTGHGIGHHFRDTLRDIGGLLGFPIP